MSFTAVMPRSGRVGGFRIPPVHGKLGIPASNHEPVGGIAGHNSTDFTSEFLQRCHAFGSIHRWLIALTSPVFIPSSRYHEGSRHNRSPRLREVSTTSCPCQQGLTPAVLLRSRFHLVSNDFQMRRIVIDCRVFRGRRF